MRAKEKRRVTNGGKFGIMEHTLKRGIHNYNGQPATDSNFVTNIAKMLKRHFGCGDVYDRLIRVAKLLANISKRESIRSVLSYKDDNPDDYTTLHKLRRFLKYCKYPGMWDDDLHYRLIMIGKKVREYDKGARELWEIKYCPKPAYKSKHENVAPSIGDTVLPVPAVSRLDPSVRDAGIEFEPACSIAQQIQKEEFNEGQKKDG